MGNTKHISFEGEFPLNHTISEEQLLECSHGTYCTIKYFSDGYLEQHKGVTYILGALHTYSMIGAKAVKFILDQMLWGDVYYFDTDFPEYKRFIKTGDLVVRIDLNVDTTQELPKGEIS